MSEKDPCVLCARDSEYDRNTPICLRDGYVEGCGQLCADCRAKSERQERTDHLLARIRSGTISMQDLFDAG